MQAGFEEIDHTADIGIRVHANTMTELFIEAANGMFQIILEKQAPPSFTETFDIVVQAEKPELLLRAWLAELLYLHATEHVYFSEIIIGELSGTKLHALARGSVMDEAMIRQATEIKAVTYHGLVLAEEDDEYNAEVIFDM